MNAVVQLSDKERAEIRKSLYENKKGDWLFILEALGDARPGPANMIKAGLITGDAQLLFSGVSQSLIDYIENELAEEAERDLLAEIERSGGRRLA